MAFLLPLGRAQSDATGPAAERQGAAYETVGISGKANRAFIRSTIIRASAASIAPPRRMVLPS
jgi:hypothetical protein